MQCGAACLAMIVNSYGVKCSLEYVSQMLHIGKMASQCLLLQRLQMKLVSIAKGNCILLNN